MTGEEKLLITVIEKLELERDRYRALLDESVDWLCPHLDSVQALAAGAGRHWCSDCQAYVRSEDDATLRDRVREALKEPEDG